MITPFRIGNAPATPPTRQQKPRKKMKQGKALEQLEKAIQEHLNSRSNNVVISNAFLIDACGIEREIDVLVHPKGNKDFGIAFECRDHKRKVGLFDIDSFIAKYNDLPQIKKVIVVSTSGFTKDARKKGMHHNIALQSINDLPYSEISKYLNVFRIFSRISICLPYDIVLEDGEKLLPYLLQKVYAVKDNKDMYLLEGEIADETKINSEDKDCITFDSGEFIEKKNCCYIAFVQGNILQFSLRELSIMQWNNIKNNRIGRLLPPYITRVQQKYAHYLQRQGLPSIPKQAIIIENNA